MLCPWSSFSQGGVLTLPGPATHNTVVPNRPLRLSQRPRSLSAPGLVLSPPAGSPQPDACQAPQTPSLPLGSSLLGTLSRKRHVPRRKGALTEALPLFTLLGPSGCRAPAVPPLTRSDAPAPLSPLPLPQFNPSIRLLPTVL